MHCPIHGDTLSRTKTKYGGRWGCTVAGCTVVCWEGSTSTPADKETRDLRHECHRLFDPLWQEPNGPFADKSSGRRKGRAFKWLKNLMGTAGADTHFGMFDAEQCRKAIEAMKGLTQDAGGDR